MRVVEPYGYMMTNIGVESEADVFTEQNGIAMLRRIEHAARVSHRSEDKMTSTSYDRFLRSVVLEHGDLSVIEHEKVSVTVCVDRGITHEWVRHRLMSYTQESTRFVNPLKHGGETRVIQPPFEHPDSIADFIAAAEFVERTYIRMLERGEKPQIARSVLLTALAAKMIVTANLRAWRHFFIMRVTAEAHPQIRQVAIPLLREFQKQIPILFEDIVPMARQAAQMKLLR